MRKLFLITALLAAWAAAMAQNESRPLRFAFLTDNHLRSGSRAIEDLRRCIADINSQDSLDFVVFGGDITDFGTDEEIRLAKQMLDSLRTKYWVVAGNHDAKWSESGCNTFKNVFGYERFEFEAGGWRFLGCNSGPDMRMAPALLPRESMEWLEGLNPGKKSIFINHYPQDSSVLNYFDVTRALKRAGVRFEIGGHWHQNRSLDYDGMPAVLCRSTLTDKERPAGYNVITLEADSISICERRIHPEKGLQVIPWYARKLDPVNDTVRYDAHGLPSSYPWLRYDVNERYPQVEELWKFQDHSNIAAGFARDGKYAWYTTTSGNVRCIELDSGRIRWGKSFPGKIFSTPAVNGRFLVFGCTDGKIYALNSKNGRVRWSVKAGKSVLASPVIFDGKVFIGASDGVFRALKLRNGAPVWSYGEVEGFVECRPYVDAGQVVFGSWGGRLYSLDTRTGSLQWTWKCSRNSRMYSPAATWPVKAAGRIFIAVPDRRVYALDAGSGKELFYAEGGREAIGLSSDGSTVLAKTMFNSSYAFRADVDVPASGGALPRSCMLWNVANGMHYEIGPSALTELNGAVLTPADKGNLHAFSLADGSELWVHKISPALLNPVEAWSEGEYDFVLVSAMDGVVSLLRVKH